MPESRRVERERFGRSCRCRRERRPWRLRRKGIQMPASFRTLSRARSRVRKGPSVLSAVGSASFPDQASLPFVGHVEGRAPPLVSAAVQKRARKPLPTRRKSPLLLTVHVISSKLGDCGNVDIPTHLFVCCAGKSDASGRTAGS